MSDNAAAPLRIVFSYAHEDHAFAQELHKALAGLQRTGAIEIWHDEDISPGTQWSNEIDAQIDRADVIIFLVSHNCCASEFVMEVELVRAERAGLKIIPLVVTDVDYDGTPFEPYEGLLKVEKSFVPISHWDRPDTAYSQVAKAIRELAASKYRPTPMRRAELRHLPGGGDWPPPMSRMVDPPAPPEVVIGRTYILGSLAAKLERHGAVALVGSGGVGKTTVALEYASQAASEYDFVAWLRAETLTTLEFDCAGVASQLGLAPTGVEGGKAGFRKWLEDNDGWLLLFDNAVDVGTVRQCLPRNRRGHVVITSRNSGWTEIAAELTVDRLSPDQAAELLRQLTGDKDAAAAAVLADLLEGRPLALRDAAVAVRRNGMSLRAYVDEYMSRLAS